MAHSSILGLEKIKENIEYAQEKLKNADEDIRKLSGRDQAAGNANENRFARRPNMEGAKRPFPAGLNRNLEDRSEFALPAKRGPLTTPVVYSRIDPPRTQSGLRISRRQEEENDEEDTRVVITSSVVRVAESRSRQQAIEELKRQESNKEKERGRRMLGVMLGTLSQFRQEAEASKRTSQVRRRILVDERVEEKDRKEQARIREAKSLLVTEKKEQQKNIRRLQQQMKVAESFDRWQGELVKMKGYIRTENKPFIFYRPRVESEESKRRIEMTEKAIDAMIEERRLTVEKDVAEAISLVKRESSHTRAISMSEASDESDSQDEAELVDVSFEKAAQEEEGPGSPNGSMASVEEPAAELVDSVAMDTSDPVKAEADGKN